MLTITAHVTPTEVASVGQGQLLGEEQLSEGKKRSRDSFSPWIPMEHVHCVASLEGI